MLARDHYATLGVPPTAAAEEIEQAYRHLSRRYHPDINPGDAHAARVFERIEEAYQVLSDPERRSRYDREGSLSEALETGAPDLAVQVLAQGEGGSYGDLFRRLRRHMERSAPLRGEDILTSVVVPLRLAERGRRISVEIHREVSCTDCGGRGRVQLQRTRPCERCGGTGRETFVKGALSVTCACADCDGGGIVAGILCNSCQGQGVKRMPETVLVRVPPGVRDGQEVRVTGVGHAGQRSGEPGDLIVRCHVESMAAFTRRGPHLEVTRAISVGDAIVGGRIEVTRLDGRTASLRIPPGTQTGRVFRLRGAGLELPDGRRGDMLVRVEIHVPESVDEDSKELIRQFAARNPQRPDSRGGSGTSA